MRYKGFVELLYEVCFLKLDLLEHMHLWKPGDYFPGAEFALPLRQAAQHQADTNSASVHSFEKRRRCISLLTLSSLIRDPKLFSLLSLIGSILLLMLTGKNIEAWIKGIITSQIRHQHRKSTWFLLQGQMTSFMLVTVFLLQLSWNLWHSFKDIPGELDKNQSVSGNFSTHSLRSIYDTDLRSRCENQWGNTFWREEMDGFTGMSHSKSHDTTGPFLPTWMSLSKWQVEQDRRIYHLFIIQNIPLYCIFLENTECQYFLRRGY